MSSNHLINKMHILVTGASGFIGKNLLDKLLSNGFRVTALVRSQQSKQMIENRFRKFNTSLHVLDGIDIVKKDVLRNVFSNIKIDVVIHLASEMDFYPRGLSLGSH